MFKSQVDDLGNGRKKLTLIYFVYLIYWLYLDYDVNKNNYLGSENEIHFKRCQGFKEHKQDDAEDLNVKSISL